MIPPADLHAAATLHAGHFVGWQERHRAVMEEARRLLRLAAIAEIDDDAVQQVRRLVGEGTQNG